MHHLWGSAGWGFFSIYVCLLNCIHRQIHTLPLGWWWLEWSTSYLSYSPLEFCSHTNKWTTFGNGGSCETYSVAISLLIVFTDEYMYLLCIHFLLNCVHRWVYVSPLGVVVIGGLLLYLSPTEWYSQTHIPISLSNAFTNKWTDI